ncbi:MAG TPA: hypothetical protein PLV93_03500, partial [Microthrixaceae bacterium]|nr:hypothetical protein [Microthrixaceae bacterium]
MPSPFDRSSIVDDLDLHGRKFVEAYTAVVDAWVVELYDDLFAGVPGVALVATGGHGRRELAPQSDLDLLLVHDGSVDLEAAQKLWYPMWDAKLKVGHSTRTVAETLVLATDDLPTATGLLTTRCLVGDEALAVALADAAALQWRKQAKRALLLL